MALYYKGKLDAKRLKQYQGRETAYLQFIETRGDGSLQLLDIKVPETMNHTQWEAGKLVEVPVEISTVNGQIYYKVAVHPAGMSGKPEK